MEDKENIITRYHPPTKYDQLPLGTICKTLHNYVPSISYDLDPATPIDDSFDLYIQLSKDTDHPDWKRFGNFLEKAFFEDFTNKKFINSCLKKYREHCSTS